MRLFRTSTSVAPVLVLALSCISSALGAVTPNAATPPPLSVVQQVCIPPQFQYDLVLGQWNYYHGYLYCQVHDAYTGGARVFTQNKDGSFTILIKGGGNIDPALMEQFGISSNVANTLYNGLHNVCS
jgi:hypothetical protein